MDVLLLSSTPSNKGGIANWVRMVLNYVKDDKDLDFSLHHVAYGTYKTLKHSFRERFIQQGFDVIRIRKEVYRLCKTNKIDVIHITATGDWSVIRDYVILKLAKRHKINTVYQMRFGRIPDLVAENGRKWKMLSKAMHLATSVWTLDERSHKTIQSIFTGKDIRTVPNPIDYSEINHVLDYNCDTENAISFVGWIIKSKGVEELLDAWQMIHKEYPSLVLKLIGPYEQKYVETLKEKYNFEGVEISGKLDHLATLSEISRSKIFILPSYTEGFPNVVAEAMALGKPIIATDVGAIPDMLSNDCGVLIHKESSDQIYSALRSLLLDAERRNRMGNNALEKAANEYSLASVFDTYKKYWSDIGRNV